MHCAFHVNFVYIGWHFVIHFTFSVQRDTNENTRQNMKRWPANLSRLSVELKCFWYRQLKSLFIFPFNSNLCLTVCISENAFSTLFSVRIFFSRWRRSIRCYFKHFGVSLKDEWREPNFIATVIISNSNAMFDGHAFFHLVHVLKISHPIRYKLQGTNNRRKRIEWNYAIFVKISGVKVFSFHFIQSQIQRTWFLSKLFNGCNAFAVICFPS